jgi:hypothetical protein
VVIGGCPRTVTFDRSSGVLDVGGIGSFQVGGSGDWLSVGDWDCDGDETPALYRPDTGEVFVFPSWGGTGAVASAPPIDARPEGIPTVRRAGHCDHLLVDGRPVVAGALP